MCEESNIRKKLVFTLMYNSSQREISVFLFCASPCTFSEREYTLPPFAIASRSLSDNAAPVDDRWFDVVKGTKLSKLTKEVKKDIRLLTLDDES